MRHRNIPFSDARGQLAQESRASLECSGAARVQTWTWHGQERAMARAGCPAILERYHSLTVALRCWPDFFPFQPREDGLWMHPEFWRNGVGKLLAQLPRVPPPGHGLADRLHKSVKKRLQPFAWHQQTPGKLVGVLLQLIPWPIVIVEVAGKIRKRPELDFRGGLPMEDVMPNFMRDRESHPVLLPGRPFFPEDVGFLINVDAGEVFCQRRLDPVFPAQARETESRRVAAAARRR